MIPARGAITLASAVILMAGTGCDSAEYEPPDRAAQVAQADSLYSSALFDTIAWEGDSARLMVGNDIFAARCRRCHGYLAEGGPVVVQGREHVIPSLVAANWPDGGDIDAIRRRIFTGHPAGMPIWGITGLELREIDAVAWYIEEVLRAEAGG